MLKLRRREFIMMTGFISTEPLDKLLQLRGSEIFKIVEVTAEAGDWRNYAI